MPGTDVTALGTAIHACIALSFVDTHRQVTSEEVERLLRSHGLEGKIAVDALLRQIESLHQWIGQRWPKCTAHPEYPVQSTLPNGQVMNGRIDLLLDTPQGWVLFDHKANPQGRSTWGDLAKEYTGQLDAYSAAITRATGRPVSERWLYLPVSGGGIRI